MVDTRLRTSFIPKKTLMAKEDQSVRASISLFLSIGAIAFFMTLATAAGVYLYKLYVDKTIATEQAQLDAAQKAFEPSLILDIKYLDNRMIAAQGLLDTHINASPIFGMLASSTLQSVQLTSFKFSAARGGDASVSVEGVAPSYPSIINQTDAFAQESAFKNSSVSGLSLNENGSIGFTMTASVDPALLLYKNTISGANSSQTLGQ